MTTDQLHDLLYDAQALLFNAIDLLETYVRQTNDVHADNYLLAQLKILASNQHGYLTSDLNIDDLIGSLDDCEGEDDTDDDAIAAGDDSTDWVAQCSGNMTWNSELRRYVPIPTGD